MVRNGEYVGKREVEEAFRQQVKADWRFSQTMALTRDYTVDPTNGNYGPGSFFRQVAGGDLTIEDFATRIPTEEKARYVIDLYLKDRWSFDCEKYGDKPTDRDARMELLRNSLRALWQNSKTYNERPDVTAAREAAESEARKIELAKGFLLEARNRAVDAAWESAREPNESVVASDRKPPAEKESKPDKGKSSGGNGQGDKTPGKNGQGGKKVAAEDEARILAEFRSLWPKVLAKVHKGENIRIKSAAQKVGDNQYRCAYKAQSAAGDNIRSLECLKKDIRDMKKYLGQ
jgi:hypothetical protein